MATIDMEQLDGVVGVFGPCFIPEEVRQRERLSRTWVVRSLSSSFLPLTAKTLLGQSSNEVMAVVTEIPWEQVVRFAHLLQSCRCCCLRRTTMRIYKTKTMTK